MNEFKRDLKQIQDQPVENPNESELTASFGRGMQESKINETTPWDKQSNAFLYNPSSQIPPPQEMGTSNANIVSERDR